jgi:acetyl esterase/lipase
MNKLKLILFSSFFFALAILGHADNLVAKWDLNSASSDASSDLTNQISTIGGWRCFSNEADRRVVQFKIVKNELDQYLSFQILYNPAKQIGGYVGFDLYPHYVHVSVGDHYILKFKAKRLGSHPSAIVVILTSHNSKEAVGPDTALVEQKSTPFRPGEDFQDFQTPEITIPEKGDTLNVAFLLADYLDANDSLAKPGLVIGEIDLEKTDSGHAQIGNPPALSTSETAAPAPAPQVVPPPQGYILQRDIQYGKASDIALLLNVAMPNPKPDKPVPAFICLHGGGWSGGTRENMMSETLFLAKNGYVGAAVEYRVVSQAPFPAQLEDCKCAVRFLRAHASDYGIDPQRIGVWGGSAGGHLAAMMGLTDGMAEFEGTGGSPGVSSAVQAVVDCFGPSDLDLWAQTVNKWANDADAQKLFAPAPPWPDKMHDWWTNFSTTADPSVAMLLQHDPSKAKWASPMTYVDRPGPVPPFLFVHGSIDTWVPLQQSIMLANALDKRGVPVSFVLKLNVGHDDAPAFPDILAYIKKTLPLHDASS